MIGANRFRHGIQFVESVQIRSYLRARNNSVFGHFLRSNERTDIWICGHKSHIANTTLIISIYLNKLVKNEIV